MSSMWIALLSLGHPLRTTARVAVVSMLHAIPRAEMVSARAGSMAGTLRAVRRNMTAGATRSTRREMRTELNAGSLHLRIPASPPDRTVCPARLRL